MPTALFSTAYCAPIQYYWFWNRYTARLMESCENYQKQSWRNRCQIATANGPMTLSLPVEGGAEKKGIQDVRLSDHGNWQHLHWYSIESAYRSSPFFEYYQDDIRPFYEKRFDYLFDFNEQIHETICKLVDVASTSTRTRAYEQLYGTDVLDLRNLIHPKKTAAEMGLFPPATPYYQVFSSKIGFQPNLSILDLIFNMGPEAILYL
jgi:hypothetical protein